ncbi:MAG: hypothetical protein WCH79_20675, partial [Planctomycetia bacterium]
VPSRPLNVSGRLDGLPVYLENTGSGWTLNLLDAPASDLTFRISYYGYLPDLVLETDSNALTTDYEDLVENTVKAIAFASINDPVAGLFDAKARELQSDAILTDKRRNSTGRTMRMGG